jgi:hypothetical protein
VNNEHSDLFQNILETLHSCDNYTALVFKSGGFQARKAFTDWQATVMAQVLQTQLVHETYINQLLKEVEIGRSKQAEETSAGTQASTKGTTQPPETPVSASTVSTLDKIKQAKKKE